MVINFTGGKVIVTPYEIVIKLVSKHKVTLEAQVDAVQLIGGGANVIAANGSETKWSLKLDNTEQLQDIANEIGLEIQ
ncbi:DUF3389 domain-containing protein [Vibrio ostreicida]|uniref:DUF3389 domain-containing protein n=1 Tax=Vibrio ostreicida TaxID=526588 RepID=A0ABT8BZ39_9VIBR|nr:DUF3389 domain-containing protein [Vibrio ostreicida]MDN3611614.1 DUF3389 domain-containing protein [Vibrio ostreicida]NPD09105.1 DUF3389 domain-containing protein [Vibrio ostreicida]